MPTKRQSIAQRNKDFDKISFMLYVQGDPFDLIRHLFDKAVYEWLSEARRKSGVVSGLQFQAAAESVLHILVDYVLAFDNIPSQSHNLY